MGEKVGAIDIGTNSIRLLVAVVDGDRVKTLRNAMQITRLGQDIGAGRLQSEAIARTVGVLRQYRSILDDEGVSLAVVAATSAVRDAVNREEFMQTVREETGLEITVLSGEEEAVLGYRGVLAGLPLDPADTIVVDVGGGSTEFVWTDTGRCHFCSLDVGAVRMTEQGADDRRIQALLAPVLQELEPLQASNLVGVGGTVTTLAAMTQGLVRYNPNLVHGFHLSYAAVNGMLGEIRSKSSGELRQMPGLQPERADIIEAGVRIVATIMGSLGREHLVVSETDILYGLALTVAGGVETKCQAVD
ncbi:MAG: Ppx/GppA family phosphatase [Desulforudis sp.]|nr:MAG: Ppx/GppA family phosphatase [Desulforudis sp.]